MVRRPFTGGSIAADQKLDRLAKADRINMPFLETPGFDLAQTGAGFHLATGPVPIVLGIERFDLVGEALLHLRALELEGGRQEPVSIVHGSKVSQIPWGRA